MGKLSSFGSGWASAGQAAADAASNIFSARQTEENQRRQIAADRYNYKRRYRWQMRDMRAAGLNPILAAQTGAGAVPGASAPGQAPTKIDIAGAYANVKNAQSQASVSSAQAAKQEMENENLSRAYKLMYPDNVAGDIALMSDYSKTIGGLSAAGMKKLVDHLTKMRNKGGKGAAAGAAAAGTTSSSAKASIKDGGLVIGIDKGKNQKTKYRKHHRKGSRYRYTKGGAY